MSDEKSNYFVIKDAKTFFSFIGRLSWPDDIDLDLSGEIPSSIYNR